MKKNQESQFNTTKNASRQLRARKIPLTAKIAAVVSFAMCIVMLVLFLIASGSGKALGKTAVFFGLEDQGEVSLSLKYALANAGFEMVSLDYADAYELPSRLKDEDCVVIAIGPDSFNVMDCIRGAGDDNVLGYCLIDPDYPGNAAVEGYSTISPNKPVAIFGLDEDAGDSDSLSGPSMIFERISGVDTVYGTPARTGGAGSYKIFSSPDMNRFLYLAADTSSVSSMMHSASFSSELARYLGLRFEGEYGLGKVNAWFLLRTVSLFLALAGLLVFLFFIPVPTPDKGEKRLRGKDSLAMIIVTGAGAWLALCTVVLEIIPAVKAFAPYLVIFAPSFLILLMFIFRAGYYLSNKTSYEPRREKITNYLIVAALEVIITLMALLLFTGLSSGSKSSLSYITAASVLLVNTFACYCLAAVDKKSRFNGEGPASYFGNPLYPISTMLPAAAGIIAALFTADSRFLYVSLIGFAISAVPYLASQTIKRSSDFCFLAATVHGIISAMLVLLGVN